MLITANRIRSCRNIECLGRLESEMRLTVEIASIYTHSELFKIFRQSTRDIIWGYLKRLPTNEVVISIKMGSTVLPHVDVSQCHSFCYDIQTKCFVYANVSRKKRRFFSLMRHRGVRSLIITIHDI